MTREELIAMLAIKGYGSAEHLAEALAATPGQVTGLLGELEAETLIASSRIGAKLTEAGHSLAHRLRQEELALADGNAVAAIYERFEPVNKDFKAAMADWQMRPGPDGPIPNDHGDTAWDTAVIERIAHCHDAVEPIVADSAAQCRRLARYGQRLAAALARVREGQTRYLSTPLIDSYHTVWFELHEDLIRLAGRNRADEAGAGRAV